MRGVILVCACVALLILIAACAQQTVVPPGTNLEDATMLVAKTMYCPVCPGVPLDVCETQACVQWRALIHQKLSDGQSPEQIQQYFYEQYGERVLGTPRAQGLNLFIYLIPIFAIAIGGGLLFWIARSRIDSRRHRANEASEISDEYRERIERELREAN